MSATIFPETAVALKENVTLMFSNLKQVAFLFFGISPLRFNYYMTVKILLFRYCNIKISMGQSDKKGSGTTQLFSPNKRNTTFPQINTNFNNLSSVKVNTNI